MRGPVLITGATGFAGGHLLEHLAGSGRFVAWGRSAPAAPLAGLAEWQRVDLLDRSRVREAIEGLRPAAIYHLAGSPQVAESWQDTAKPLESNVMASAHLFDAVRRARLDCRILVTGSAAVYSPSETPIIETHPLGPANPYAVSKLAQEQLAARAAADDGLDVVIARPFNHTGPRQRSSYVAPSIARQLALIEHGQLEPVLRVGNLDAQRDFSDVRDVVRAYVLLMERGVRGRMYNIGSGVGRSIRSLLDALVSRCRAEVRVEIDASRLRPADTSSLVADISRIRQETGWEPGVAFEKTLDDLLDFWRTEVQPR